MKDRLQKFMEIEKLTSSRLAEILGVQPSNISHILGGRNKPSFEFIEKVLLRFPKINPDWLLLGKGPVYRPDTEPVQQTTVSISQPSAPSLFPELPPQKTQPERIESSQTQKTTAVSETDHSDTKEKNTETPSSLPDKKTESDVERIVVFFRDKSFICYQPK